MINLDELKQLEAAATPGPWQEDEAFCPDHKTTSRAIYYVPRENYIYEVIEDGCECGEIILSKEDAALIIALRNATPELFALAAENAALLDLIDEFVEQDCTIDGGQYDSMATTTYAEAIDLLAEHDRLVIKHSSGRRRIARRKTKAEEESAE